MVRTPNKDPGDFLAIMAHELRTPITVIQLVAERLVERRSPDPLLERVGRILERQVVQMGRLVDDLLDLTRLQHGHLALRCAAVELSGVVRAALDDCMPLAEQAGVSLAAALPPEPLWVHGDPVRLAQVTDNLVSNAIKFSERGAVVRVELGRRDDRARLVVADAGIGIEAHELEAIFDAFAQTGRGRTRSPAGLGLGLAIVKELVELHGGQVAARSEGPGHGAEFRVELPLLPGGGSAGP